MKPIAQREAKGIENAGTGGEPRFKLFGACEIQIPPPCGLVIFGASGDLTGRKIVPSLYHLYANRMLPDNFFIVGVARAELTTERFRGSMHDAVKEALGDRFDDQSWNAFSRLVYYARIDYGSFWNDLKDPMEP